MSHCIFDQSLHSAKVHCFAIHSFHANDTTVVTHGFAIVTWPLQHPGLNTSGKLYQVWCSSVYDTSSDNCHFLITAQHVLNEETVLVRNSSSFTQKFLHIQKLIFVS